MKKAVFILFLFVGFLSISSIFALIPFSQAKAETSYIPCPSSLKVSVEDGNYGFGESNFSEYKTWPKDTSFPMANCRGNAYPISEYKTMQTSAEVSKIAPAERNSGDKPKYPPYGNIYKTEQFGKTGKTFLSGYPYTEQGDPRIEVQTRLGECEITLLGLIGSTKEGQKIYDTGLNPPERKMAAEKLIKIITEAATEIEGNITSQSRVASFCEVKSNVVSGTPQPQKSQSDQATRAEKTGQDTNPIQAINDWVKDTFSDLDFDAIEAERFYGRTPEMTEKIINQYIEEQRALFEEPSESPYRLDILEGDVAIKLPGQTEWSTLKQGERIPSGSTIFTGMDSTAVLSIRDKGIIQVQSFTEITVTEKGLEEAAKIGQTYTDIELRTGEVELNLPTGIFTGSLQVHTPNFVAGVRGTHFWVSYVKDKKLSTTGVYEGMVEVTTKDGKTTSVSPNGDKPGLVVVTQKLSTTKLAVAGLILVAIIAGAIVFLKRKKGEVFGRKR